MSVVEQHASLVEAERSLRLLQLVAEAEHFAGQLALLDGDVPLAIGSLDPSTVQINPETETGETIEGVVASVPGMGPVATKEVVGGSAIQPRYVEADDGVEVGPVIRADQDQQIVPAETTSTRPTSITRRTQSPSSRVVDPDRKKGSEGGGGNADPLRQYLRETSKYPLLTKEDEVQLAKIIEAGNKATAELEAQPEMEIDVEKVEHIMKIKQDISSLDASVREDEEDSVLGDFIEDEDTVTPEESATGILLKEHVNVMLSALSDREQKILKLRFGLEDGRSHTLEEVGQEFNVTRERIRQIEAKALAKLRKHKDSRKLHDYIK